MINRIGDLETCIRNGYIIQFTQKFCYSVCTFLENRTRAAVAKTVLFELVTILVIFQFGFFLFNTSISLQSPFSFRIFPCYSQFARCRLYWKLIANAQTNKKYSRSFIYFVLFLNFFNVWLNVRYYRKFINLFLFDSVVLGLSRFLQSALILFRVTLFACVVPALKIFECVYSTLFIFILAIFINFCNFAISFWCGFCNLNIYYFYKQLLFATLYWSPSVQLGIFKHSTLNHLISKSRAHELLMQNNTKKCLKLITI